MPVVPKKQSMFLSPTYLLWVEREVLWAGMASSVAVPTGAPELGVQPSRNCLLEVLVKMLMIFGLGFFLCLLPQLLDVFPPLTFCFRRVPFLTLKISKAPKAAPTAFYVPQQLLTLLPSSVFYLSLCCILGGAVATLCPWPAATGNQALAVSETLTPCCHAGACVVGLPTNP